MKPLRRATYWLLMLASVAVPPSPALTAAPPASFSGELVRAADGDTFFVKRSDGSEVKVRLHNADAAEIAHNRREVDQPGGRDALAYVQKNWQGKTVTVDPKGESYGRIVADVTETASKKSLALDLVSAGLAAVDQRYGKPAALLAAEAEAKKEKRGIWKEDKVIPPWDWRAQHRTRAPRRPRGGRLAAA